MPSIQCAVLTSTTTTVSTTFATGSLPSVSIGSTSAAAAVADITAIIAATADPAPATGQTTAVPGAAATVAAVTSTAASTAAAAPPTAAPPPVAPVNAPPPPPDPAAGLIASALNLTYDDLAQALLQCFAREDVSDKLTDKFTIIVSSLINKYREQHDIDQVNIQKLFQIVADLKTEINDLEQYSRRNSVRINCQNWREFPHEDCEKLVLDLAWDLGFRLEPWMIDRCHRTGKHIRGRERDILVKFISYKFKDSLIKARIEAGANPVFRNVYINEDLSAETSKLFFKARAMKKEKKLFSAGTRDGKILVSRYRGDSAVVIRNETELNDLAARGTFANVARRAPAEDSINTRFHREAGMPPQRRTNRAPPPQQQRSGSPRSERYQVQPIPPYRRSGGNQPSIPGGPGNAQPGPSISNIRPPVDTSTPTNNRQRRNSFTILPEFRPVSFSFECY